MEEVKYTQPRSLTPSTSDDGSPNTSPSINSKMQPMDHQLISRGESRKSGHPRSPEEKLLLDVSSNSYTYSSCPSPLSCNKKQHRLVTRENGRTNVHRRGISNSKWAGFLKDSFTTIINYPWPIILIIFVVLYVLSWIIFGGLWLMASKVSGTVDNQTCLHNVTDFSSAIIFSVETQVTIGFGNNYVTNDCYFGVILLILQCLVGLIMDAFLLGLIFTKITRPRNRRKTILFSQRAVLCQDDEGARYIEFRIGNLRKSQIAECHVRLMLYWYRKYGERQVFEQHDLECGYENGTDRLVLLTPVIVRHRINQSSPLWGVSPVNIGEEELEMVVILEGVVEATGLTLQALWSFTANEIVPGKRLGAIVSRENGNWVVHFDKFNNIEPMTLT